MGREYDITKYSCGCEKHYEYNECCGMGPIAGSQREWWVHNCEEHKIRDAYIRGRMDTLRTEIRNLESQQRTLHDEILKKGRDN